MQAPGTRGLACGGRCLPRGLATLHLSACGGAVTYGVPRVGQMLHVERTEGLKSSLGALHGHPVETQKEINRHWS